MAAGLQAQAGRCVVSGYEAALGGAVAAIGVGAVLIARAWPTPTGRHRSGRPVPPPVEAMERAVAWCSTEHRVTEHFRTRVTQQFICFDCRQPSTDPRVYESREGAQ